MSDVLEVVQAIYGKCDWSMHPILLHIKSISSLFGLVAFSHIPGMFSSVAHDFAKIAPFLVFNYLGVG